MHHDHSSYSETIRIQFKSDVVDAVIKRLTEWESQTGSPLIILRTRHGTEYKRALKRWSAGALVSVVETRKELFVS